MKKKVYLLLVFLVFSSVYSQKKEIPGIIINDKNDTLKVNIIVDVNFFDQTLIRELSILKKITYLDAKGIKNKIVAKDVKMLVFEDSKAEKQSWTENKYFATIFLKH